VLGPSLAAASPAVALYRDDGAELGGSLSALMTLLVFVVAPIALFLGIALLVTLPSIIGGPRYRPGLGWRATPEWYGGPEEEVDTGPAGKPEPGRRVKASADEEAAAGGSTEAVRTGQAAGAEGVASGAEAAEAGRASEAPSGRRGDSAADSSDGGASARW
jgi:hypothetical protein